MQLPDLTPTTLGSFDVKQLEEGGGVCEKAPPVINPEVVKPEL